MRPGWVIVLASVCLVPSVAAQVNPQTIPGAIHLAYGADPSTSMTVAWQGVPVADAHVEYGTTTDYGTIAAGTMQELPGTASQAWTAHLDGLTPDTTYYYRVVQQNGRSDPLWFHTPAREPESIRITAWGDQGVPDELNELGEADGYSPVETTRLAMNLAPDLHLHAGDLSYANGVPRTWDEYFQMLEPFASHTPYMSAVGNHEREAGESFLQYDRRLPMPTDGTNRWWTVKLGNTQIVSLDTEQACAPLAADDLVPGIVARTCDGGANPAQLDWLKQTLAAARDDPDVKWIIAFHHYLLWSDGEHGSDLALRAIWGPVYDAAHVDLVIQAHDHLYERTKTIVGDAVAQAGTTYVTVGVGGASHYAFQSPDDARPDWEAAHDNEHYGALFLNVTDGLIRARFHGIDGEIHDQFAIAKNPAGLPIQVAYPEDVAPTQTPLLAPPQMPGPGLVAALLALGSLALVRRLR